MTKQYKVFPVGVESRASTYFAVLFGTAVITILAIRAFLAATGYPQVGGDSLHIAHMLWGGFFMLAAIILLLYIHGHRAKIFGALLGGIGFGFFIDELGKFITKDNDYFYRPAAMLIYVIFLLLWALFEWLESYTPVTKEQKYVDAMTRLRDGAIHGLTEEDTRKIQSLLTDSGLSSSNQKQLLVYAKANSPEYKANTFVRFAYRTEREVNQWIRKVVNSKITPKVLYIYITLATAISGIFYIYSLAQSNNIFDIYSSVPAFIELGYAVSLIATIISVVIGLYYAKRNWKRTLLWYRRAMLVNVFGTQVFLFYINQFTAAFGLVLSIGILYILTIMEREYETFK